MANLVAIILPTVLGSLLVIFCGLYILTVERRKRRKTLLARDEWTVGKDLQRGVTWTEWYVDGIRRDKKAAGNIVLDGEWFPLGKPGDKTWCCCGAVWADDLAERGLNWKELEARRPDENRTGRQYRSTTTSTSHTRTTYTMGGAPTGGC